mmetsp:Transcript_87966/g.221960  ORF Transcript_87966/g.221960 Transcript_87966/m.221960 type:complete len:301 (+) Transcript_87966:773-1675(+)
MLGSHWCRPGVRAAGAAAAVHVGRAAVVGDGCLDMLDGLLRPGGTPARPLLVVPLLMSGLCRGGSSGGFRADDARREEPLAELVVRQRVRRPGEQGLSIIRGEASILNFALTDAFLIAATATRRREVCKFPPQTADGEACGHVPCGSSCNLMADGHLISIGWFLANRNQKPGHLVEDSLNVFPGLAALVAPPPCLSFWVALALCCLLLLLRPPPMALSTPSRPLIVAQAVRLLDPKRPPIERRARIGVKATPSNRSLFSRNWVRRGRHRYCTRRQSTSCRGAMGSGRFALARGAKNNSPV